MTLPEILDSNGHLSVKMLKRSDIISAQKLRYDIFYTELGANNPPKNGLDSDVYDDLCDHLGVYDNEQLCGVYRLLRRESLGGIPFYSANEFDIQSIYQLKSNICEFGRSCVAKEYRTKPVMELLWRGIASYVMHYKIDIMFGCASFLSLNGDEIHKQLQYLHKYHLADRSICPSVLPSNRAVSIDFSQFPDLTDREKLKYFSSLPALIKAYIRLGGFIGNGAYLDIDFNTTDVFIIVETKKVSEQYYQHFTKHLQNS